MPDGPGSSPAGPPPEDPRPRPKYGELAPEGWTWPPHEKHGHGGHPATPGQTDPRHPSPRAAQPPPANAQFGPGPLGVSAWDRPVTLGLLLIGLLGTFFSASILTALPQAVQMLYTQQDLGSYTPAASVAGLITGGIIVQALIWLGTAAWSILLLVRRRRAFYAPLIGGVVSFVAIFVFMSIVLASDPTLLDFYSRP